MVDKEFVIDDWDQFYEFVKERPIAYKFIEVTNHLSFYAYLLGSERIAYDCKAKDEKDFEMKIKLLKKQGFVSGFTRPVK